MLTKSERKAESIKLRMKLHTGHIAMCAPMIVIGGVLLASGAGVGASLTVVGCVLMMAVLMQAMGHSSSPAAGGAEPASEPGAPTDERSRLRGAAAPLHRPWPEEHRADRAAEGARATHGR